MRLLPLLSVTWLFSAVSPATETPPAPPGPPPPSTDTLYEDYNQWKEARGTGTLAAAAISAPPGFTVELMRPAREEEGSWVSMAFDSRDRLILSREDRGLLRMTLPGKDGSHERVESFAEELEECRGLLFAEGALFANANNSRGLYRLRDADGDDTFEEIRRLCKTEGGVGHGRNDLAAGPDGFLYSIHGDDVAVPGDSLSAFPLPLPAPAGLLPCAWETHLYGEGAPHPQGYLARVRPDGSAWEALATGLRNPYGIAFNEDGEAFTYDADLEWDIGLPWYHPTRVLHLVPGADYGWRRSTASPPPWLPDSRPSVADIGKGSPTAISFGTRSRFPGKWRRALYILDWAYGRIWAVHLTPRGASYTGSAELFLQGRPLNVTDLTFGPDGALWFITGGRKTRSALYRVRFSGAAVAEEVPPAPGSPEAVERQACAEARTLRRKLEALVRSATAPEAVDFAWPHLGHADGWIRHAARGVVESRPADTWQDRALLEAAPDIASTVLLALARAAPPGRLPAVLERLRHFPLSGLSVEARVTVLRACAVALIRLRETSAAAGPGAALTAWLEAGFPDREGDFRVNRQLCELLAAAGSPAAVSRSLPLLAAAGASQEEVLYYLHTLRLAKTGWTTAHRILYFDTLRRAVSFKGAHHLPLVLKYIHADALSTLSAEDRTVLAAHLAPPEPLLPPVVPPNPNRRFVQAWQITDFDADLPGLTRQRNLHRGRQVFAEAVCVHCHVFGGEGTDGGPDLTGAAARFPRRDLLQHILEPSRVIAESYRNISVTTADGLIRDGRFVAEDAKSLTLATNPVDPERRWTVKKKDIATRQDSPVSPMPPALLNNFTRAELLDLLAWLEFGPVPETPGPPK